MSKTDLPEGFFERAVQRLPVMYGYVSPDLVLLYHNTGYADWIGRPGEVLTGLPIAAFLPPDSLAQILPYLNRALRGETVRFERRREDGDGTRYAMSAYSPERDGAGQVRGIHIHGIDMTELRRAEQDRRRRRDQFEGAFNHGAVAMALVAPDGRFLKVNTALCTMLGYSEEQLLSGDFQQLTHPDDLEPDLNNVGRLLRGEIETYTMEKRYFHREGRVMHAILSVSLVRDSDGAPEHFVALIQDITDRKLAEERLHWEHELAQVTLNSIADGVITCGPDGRITSINPVAEELTGWRRSEAVGVLVEGVIELRDAEGRAVPNRLLEALQLGKRPPPRSDCVLVNRRHHVVPVEDSAAPIRNRAGAIVGGVLVFRDVSRQRALASRLDHMAHHDLLTDLPNRVLFRNRCAPVLAEAARGGRKCAVFFCDLDRFKAINDTLGHSAGDEVLRIVANRLRAIAPAGQTICRWAGDEFAILIPETGSEADLERLARSVIAAVRTPIRITASALPVETGMSIGIAVFPDDAETEDELMAAADAALLEVKRRGGNGHALHHVSMSRAMLARADTEKQLRDALRRGSFEVHYQPRIDLASRRLLGVEALVRMKRDGALIPPGQFIPVAEESGLIHELSRWVFAECCRQVAAWKARFGVDIKVAVNLSPMRFGEADLVSQIMDQLEEHALSPLCFEFEITENALLSMGSTWRDMILELHRLGFTLSLDDFGTGFSNIAYLTELPVDTLKIDRSFVGRSREEMVIAKAIVDLGLSLGKQVVAEGIETEIQAELLRDMGCPEGQGFLFDRGLPAAEFEARYLSDDGPAQGAAEG